MLRSIYVEYSPTLGGVEHLMNATPYYAKCKQLQAELDDLKATFASWRAEKEAANKQKEVWEGVLRKVQTASHDGGPPHPPPPQIRHPAPPAPPAPPATGAGGVARVREDAVSDAKGRPRTALKKFVRDKMLRDYGLRSTAEKMGRDLRSSVERFSQEWKHGGATMAPVGRIRYFYEALYNFAEGGDDAWSERQVAFYFAAVGALAPDEKTLCAVDAAIPYSDAGHAVEAVCIAPATRKALLEKVKALPPIAHPETDDPEKKAVEAKGGGLAGGAVKRTSAIVVKEPEVSRTRCSSRAKRRSSAVSPPRAPPSVSPCSRSCASPPPCGRRCP